MHSALLTVLLLLGQDGDLLPLGEVQEEQHCLLSDDVCKVYVVYLEKEQGGWMSAVCWGSCL